jgi:hypothetical protein
MGDMSPFQTGSLALGGIQAGLSLISGLIERGQAKKAREALEDLPIPDASKFYLDSKLMEAARLGDPTVFTAAVQGPSAMEGISEDPRLRQMQMQELGGLQSLAETGFTPQMEADIMRSQTAMGTTARGAREAALQKFQSQGTGGSGVSMASQMLANQNALGSAAQSGADIAARKQANQMQALQAMGGRAGQVRGQEWGQGAQKASAADEIAARNMAARNFEQQERSDGV